MIPQNPNFSNSSEFVISEYLPLLKPSSKKGKYICPVCNGNELSINKDGKRYSCFDGCKGKEVAYKLREANGEFNGAKRYTTHKPSQNSSQNSLTESEPEEKQKNKMNLVMEVLDFLDVNYKGRIAYNVRCNEIEIDGTPIRTDCLRASFARKHRIDVSSELLKECFLEIALCHQYDPVENHLNRCKLAQPIDLQGLAYRFFGCEGELYDTYFRKWLIGCVARIYEPGCKLDEVLILQGAQGYGKSTFFNIMGADWFSDSMTGDLDKDDLMLMNQNWILEWGELDGFTARTYHGKIKRFLSSQQDSYRLPYGRDVQQIPRRSVIVGSTNRNDFLNDPTGNRRFWIIPVEKSIPLKEIEALRESIWCAAVAAYQEGEEWKLPQGMWESQTEANRQYEQHDPWEDIILTYLETQYNEHAQEYLPVTTAELLGKLEESGCTINRTRSEQMRMADIMRREGWKSKQVMRGKQRVREWRKFS